MSVVKQNIIANFGGKSWKALMSIVFVPLYIKFMGIESYGLVGCYTTLTAVFGLLDMGLSTTLTRELGRLSAIRGKSQEMRNLVRTLELPYWGIALLIGISVTLLSGPLAAHWIRANRLSIATIEEALIIMAADIAFRWPISLYMGGLMGLQKHVPLNAIIVFTATIRGVGAVLVLWLVSPTIQAFFLWQIFSSCIQVCLTAGTLWRSLPKGKDYPRFQKDILLGIWHFAAGVTGISAAATLLTQIDKIILCKLLYLQMFGYYALATTMASALYYLIYPISMALFPKFSQLVGQNDKVRLAELYHKGCQFMSVIILPAGAIGLLFSKSILYVWTGDPQIVTNTHKAFGLLIVGTTLNGLMNLPYRLQLAHGWTSLGLWSNAIALIISAPLIYFLAVNYGPIGAASAWVLLNAGYILISLQIMHSRLLVGEQTRWYLEDVGIPLIPVLLVPIVWNMVVPNALPRDGTLLSLIGVTVTTFFIACMITPVTKKWILSKILRSCKFNNIMKRI